MKVKYEWGRREVGREHCPRRRTVGAKTEEECGMFLN